MNRRIPEDDEPPAKVPGWAMTYIDLLWVLLLFFILRSAIGDGKRYPEIAAALKKQFGLEAAATAGDGETQKGEAIAKDRTHYGEIVREGLDETAAARKRALTACGALYFPEGECKLQSEQKQILQAVAEQIGRGSEVIEIRGEAEKNANAEKPDRSAADPAYARCVEARDYLVKLGIEPRRLRIAVVGERRLPGEKPRVQLYSVAEVAAEMPGENSDKTMIYWPLHGQ